MSNPNVKFPIFNDSPKSGQDEILKEIIEEESKTSVRAWEDSEYIVKRMSQRFISRIKNIQKKPIRRILRAERQMQRVNSSFHISDGESRIFY